MGRTLLYHITEPYIDEEEGGILTVSTLICLIIFQNIILISYIASYSYDTQYAHLASIATLP